MDRKELFDLIEAGPIKIRMKDGREYDIEHPREAIVSEIAAHVLYRDDEDGKLRVAVLPLVTMSGVIPIPAA